MPTMCLEALCLPLRWPWLTRKPGGQHVSIWVACENATQSLQGRLRVNVCCSLSFRQNRANLTCFFRGDLWKKNAVKPKHGTVTHWWCMAVFLLVSSLGNVGVNWCLHMRHLWLPACSVQVYTHTQKGYTKVEQVAGTEHRRDHGDESVPVLSPSEWQSRIWDWGGGSNLILQVILKCGTSHRHDDSEAEPLTVFHG